MFNRISNWREYFARTSPFVCIHAVLLLAISWQCLSLLPTGRSPLDALQLTLSYSRELILLGAIYFLVGSARRKWALATSTAVLVALVTLTSLCFLITIKTRVVYGASFLLDEFIPFVLYYGPSYVTPFSIAFAIAALGGLAALPYGMLALGRRSDVFQGAMTSFSVLFLSLAMLSWFSPLPSGVPEYISKGPLQSLLSATIRESEYRERSSARLAEVGALLDASMEMDAAPPPAFLSESMPFEKVILYQMEGVSEMIFRPDSDHAFLLPRLGEWADHAIRFTNHYTLSTLTFHSYQAINIGGYIRSGSRLETVGIGSVSLAAR